MKSIHIPYLVELLGRLMQEAVVGVLMDNCYLTKKITDFSLLLLSAALEAFYISSNFFCIKCHLF